MRLEDELNLPAVIRPVQQRLPLSRPAKQIAWLAVPFDLAHMPAHGFPSLDLPAVLGAQPAAHVIAAIPLEPAARIVGMNPPLVAPDRQRLAGVDPEKVERAVAVIVGELSAGELGFSEIPCAHRSCTCR